MSSPVLQRARTRHSLRNQTIIVIISAIIPYILRFLFIDQQQNLNGLHVT